MNFSYCTVKLGTPKCFDPGQFMRSRFRDCSHESTGLIHACGGSRCAGGPGVRGLYLRWSISGISCISSGVRLRPLIALLFYGFGTAVCMLALYVVAARSEERKFGASSLAAAYEI